MSLMLMHFGMTEGGSLIMASRCGGEWGRFSPLNAPIDFRFMTI